jgi:hypothetical protein
MVAYMTIYLFIISYAIKDGNTVPLLIAYAISCGAGNYAIMLWEKKKGKYSNSPHLSKVLLKLFFKYIKKNDKSINRFCLLTEEWCNKEICIGCTRTKRIK